MIADLEIPSWESHLTAGGSHKRFVFEKSRNKFRKLCGERKSSSSRMSRESSEKATLFLDEFYR